MNVKKVTGTAAVVVTTAVSVFVAPGAAQAATKYHTKTRGDCVYEYTSSPTFAMTTKTDGNCAGHAWVRYKDSLGRIADWYHLPNQVTRSATSSNKFVWTEHKSQENESPWRGSH
jgi:hypothetical protein